MRIQTTNDSTRFLYDDQIMQGEYEQPGIEFSENNIANVKESVGEQLIEKYDDIQKYESE